MKLSTRLTLALVALVVLTVAAVSYFSYRSVETIIAQRSLARMEVHTRLLANEVQAVIRSVSTDILGFRAAAAIDGIIRAHFNAGRHPGDGTSEATWRERMARRFVGELKSKSDIYQFRIIGLDNDGREIVRVDRGGPDGGTRIVPDSELQSKVAQDYFTETIKLPPGALYFSSIDLNREHGKVEEPRVPVLRVATPLHAGDGRLFGILVVNLDMREIFARLRETALPGAQLYVVDTRGNYLLHPDPAREFEFESGISRRLQNDFPDLAAALMKNGVGARFIRDRTGDSHGASFATVMAGSGIKIIVIESEALSQIMQPAIAARRANLGVGAIALLIAVVLAILLARSVTRPLKQMTGAVEAFAQGKPTTVPTKAAGEIGVLARAFDSMAREARDKTIALQQEIDEHRRTEAKLRDYAKREQLYISAVNSSRYAFLTVNLDGQINSWNPGAERLFGYTEAEALGRHIFIIVPEDRYYEIDAIADKIYRDEPILNLETARLHKDGRRIDVNLTASPVRDDAGAVIGTSGIISDATEQKLAERNFRLAVEASPSGMIVTDQDGAIVLVNSEVERLFGYRRKELLGQPVEILLPADLRAGHGRMREKFADHPIKRDMAGRQNLVGQRKNGAVFPIEVGLSPFRGRDGLMIICAIADITERQRNERLKDEFVATVSHELRTPLTSIAGSLGLLVGNAAGHLPAPATRLLTIAHQNSQRLVRLINEVLDIEKIESGKIIFQLKRVEVRSLVEQAIEAMRGFADGYGVRIRLDPDSDVAEVQVDSDRLTQVVTNLLSNAAKFSPQGEEVLVAVKIYNGNDVRITVRDRGPGIPPEFKPQIFKKFAQADTSDARQKGGTGLGLNIAQQIVLRLHGEIGFADADGGGTIFHVDLPRFSPDHAAEDGRGDMARGTRLLICDDDPSVVHMLADRLGAVGFVCDVAFNGREAINRAVAMTYAAILVDLRLPDCDGIGLIQKLRAQTHNRQTPIIVVPIDPVGGRDDLRSANLDILDWFQKPVDIKRLTQVLEGPIATKAAARPRILHIDEDAEVLGSVADALEAAADIVSVDSIEAARVALTAHSFDLVVVDLPLATSPDLFFQFELCDRDGDTIPVILLSAQANGFHQSAAGNGACTNARASIDRLIATLSKRLGGPMPFKATERERSHERTARPSRR